MSSRIDIPRKAKGKSSVTMRRAKRAEDEVTKSSGNVFADIGIPNPEEHRLKADLVISVRQTIDAKKLTQVEAAKRMGLSQPDVSKLLRGHFRTFSIERIMKMLNKLGQDVTIGVTPAQRKTGETKVAELRT
jgi:predicted XRE-type DNA-binding protein